MRIYYLIPILVCGFWNIVTTILVYEALRRRGTPVNFLWLRVTILRYLGQYRDITRQETGRIGPLYYHWIVSINLALFFALAMLALYLIQ